MIFTKPEPQIDARTPAQRKADNEFAKAQRFPDAMVSDWETRMNQFWANADQDFFDALGEAGGEFFSRHRAWGEFMTSQFASERPDLSERIQARFETVPAHEIAEDGRVTLLVELDADEEHGEGDS